MNIKWDEEMKQLFPLLRHVFHQSDFYNSFIFSVLQKLLFKYVLFQKHCQGKTDLANMLTLAPQFGAKSIIQATSLPYLPE